MVSTAREPGAAAGTPSDAKPPTSDAKSLASNAKTPASDAMPPASNAKTPASEAQPPESDALPLESDTKSLASEAASDLAEPPSMRAEVSATIDDDDPHLNTCRDNSEEEDAERTARAPTPREPGERIRDVFYQSCLPFLCGGLTAIVAGLVLNWAQESERYREVPELIAITPPLQGAKGNIEMTLTSRLTTMAHKGVFTYRTKYAENVVLANLGLVQGQILILSLVAFLITLLPSLYRYIHDGCTWHGESLATLASTAVVSMSMAAVVTATLLAVAVIVSKRCNLNPDNILTPAAASLSDVFCLLSMILFSFLLYMLSHNVPNGITYTILLTLFFISFIPLWFRLAYRTRETKHAAQAGWFSMFVSLALSSGCGTLLAAAVAKFDDITIFGPIICGVSGNRMAMQCSRISTYLHTSDLTIGELPRGRALSAYLSPKRAFASNDLDSRAARFLLFTSTPYQLFFLTVIFIYAHVRNDTPHFSFTFTIAYLIGTFMHLTILLYLSQLVVYTLWRYRIDPDTHAIPLLAGYGDFAGTVVLYTVFEVVNAIRAGDVTLGKVVDGTESELSARNSSMCFIEVNSTQY